MTFKTNVSVPCSCGCGKEVSIDGLGTAPYVSHEGQKLFCSTHDCARKLSSKIEGGQFLDAFNDALNSPEGKVHMDEVAALLTGETKEENDDKS